MEELWVNADAENEKKCTVAFDKANDVFSKLFDWLDRDSDGNITLPDVKYGISRIMIKDIDDDTLSLMFQDQNKQPIFKLTKEMFLLKIANGQLDKAFLDSNFKESFIK